MVVPLKHDAASLMLFSATTNLQICVSNLKIRPRRSHGNFLSSPSTPAAPPPIRPTRHKNTPPPHQASTSCYLQPLSKAVPLAAISGCWADCAGRVPFTTSTPSIRPSSWTGPDRPTASRLFVIRRPSCVHVRLLPPQRKRKKQTNPRLSP